MVFSRALGFVCLGSSTKIRKKSSISQNITTCKVTSVKDLLAISINLRMKRLQTKRRNPLKKKNKIIVQNETNKYMTFFLGPLIVCCEIRYTSFTGLKAKFG